MKIKMLRDDAHKILLEKDKNRRQNIFPKWSTFDFSPKICKNSKIPIFL